MFLGGIGDFLFPNLIGIIMNAMKEGDKTAVTNNIGYWLIIISVGALSTMLQGILFGIVSERIGNNLRTMLFTSLLKKDVAFYDDNRTGELRKLLVVNIISFKTLI
jgi:ABC-type multidrug transport system fused ATPase/permease subunit